MNAPIRTPEELQKEFQKMSARIEEKERRRKLRPFDALDVLAAALIFALTGLAFGGSRYGWAFGVGFGGVYLAEIIWNNRLNSLKSRIEVLEDRVRQLEAQRR